MNPISAGWVEHPKVHIYFSKKKVLRHNKNGEFIGAKGVFDLQSDPLVLCEFFQVFNKNSMYIHYLGDT